MLFNDLHKAALYNDMYFMTNHMWNNNDKDIFYYDIWGISIKPYKWLSLLFWCQAKHASLVIKDNRFYKVYMTSNSYIN